MIKKKTIINIIIFFTIIMILISYNSYAMVEITKDNLLQSLQSVIKSELIEEYGINSVEVGEETITMTSTSKQYEMKYNLTGDITFEVEMNIQNGMTYDEYEEENEKFIGPVMGYLAVANLNNVDISKAFTYFGLTYVSSGLANSSSQSSEYVILDDRNSENTSVSVEGKKTIKASEFPNYAMEYANSIYSEPITMNDEEANTYQLHMEQQDVSDNSCKVVLTLTIKSNADLSIINQIGESEETPSENEQNQEEQKQEETNNQQTQANEKNNLPTTNDKQSNNNVKTTQLPKTGIDTKICIAIILVVILIVVFGIKYRNLKDVK